MIRNWIKAKKLEIECKLIVYTYAAALLREHREYAAMIKRICNTLKDSSPEEILDKLIGEIAVLVHEQSA